MAADLLDVRLGRSWSLQHVARPPTLNSERSGHWSRRSVLTAEWREAFWVLARAERVPRLERAIIVARHDMHGARPDVGACVPAVKAGVDGLVDAGVLVDDDPGHLLAVVFVTPVRAQRAALTLDIHEVIGWTV